MSPQFIREIIVAAQKVKLAKVHTCRRTPFAFDMLGGNSVEGVLQSLFDGGSLRNLANAYPKLA